MTTQEAQQLKLKLTQDIEQLLESYSKSTGLAVKSIDVNLLSKLGSVCPESYLVQLEVHL